MNFFYSKLPILIYLKIIEKFISIFVKVFKQYKLFLIFSNLAFLYLSNFTYLINFDNFFQ